MKVEDSGMPEEAYWNSLFDIEAIISWLNIKEKSKIVEIGCGYGTFTVPLARVNKDIHLHAFDIEQKMLEQAQSNVQNQNLNNVSFVLKDVLIEGLGLKSESIDLVLMFNILHSEFNKDFLKEAHRVLKPNGIIAIIHWRKDISTPRGPRVKSRPDLRLIQEASQGLILKLFEQESLLKPYHWGLKLIKNHED